jgi:glycosyltransferase involved in cell wall biosynthesis
MLPKEDTKKNVLMVCYYYPPLMDVGCKRSVAFSKYFKKYGWTPYVLSVKNPDRKFCTVGDDAPPLGVHTEYSYSIINVYKFFGKFNGLLTRVLKFIGVELKRNYFYDIFCIPDIFFGWIPLATIKGFRLIKQYNIDIVYVSCRPFSSAIIGVLLKAVSKKPLVLDFRDPYALDVPSYVVRPKFRRLMDRKIESYFLKQANALIVTSEELRGGYVQRYPELKDRIFALHNGFDPELLIQKNLEKYPKFTIVYAGNFYLGVQVLEIFTHSFFEGVSKLKKYGNLNASNFQFLYYSNGMAAIQQIAMDYGIQDLVTARSRVTHKKMLSVLSKSHLQLIRVIKPMISTKLFEGLALNIPLLATIPCGEVEEIINKYSPSSYVINKNSPGEVADAILDAMQRYKDDKMQCNHVTEFMEKFSRENLTLKLMKIIEEKMQMQRGTS